MSRLPLIPRRHDPFWDMDGADVRRQRTRQRAIRLASWLVVMVVLAVVVTRLPSIDPEFLVQGEGRPLLAGAMLTMLAAATLLALARIRFASRS